MSAFLFLKTVEICFEMCYNYLNCKEILFGGTSLNGGINIQ